MSLKKWKISDKTSDKTDFQLNILLVFAHFSLEMSFYLFFSHRVFLGQQEVEREHFDFSVLIFMQFEIVELEIGIKGGNGIFHSAAPVNDFGVGFVVRVAVEQQVYGELAGSDDFCVFKYVVG